MLRDAPLFSVVGQKFNVIILAAGLGRRLQPETDYIPKALVSLGEARAIDYSLCKFQFLADRVIIAAGYCADLLENYVRGKYLTTNLVFSREDIVELSGPGASFLYALDAASSRLPTIVTFCDFIFDERFPVDRDAIVVCNPGDPNAVVDRYKTVAIVEEETVLDIVPNPNPEGKENGFTGTCICHDTVLLKSIAYSQANAMGTAALDYTRDVIRNYVRRIHTIALPVSRIFEFGTEESLARTRGYLNGNHPVHR